MEDREVIYILREIASAQNLACWEGIWAELDWWAELSLELGYMPTWRRVEV